MKLLVGLGNLGTRYQQTRHNAGFMIADRLALAHAAVWRDEPRLKARLAMLELTNGQAALLAKPTTMMNGSGQAIQRLMQRYRLEANDVWVICDDIDTPFGQLRLRRGGASGGHQGLNSIIDTIGRDFRRVKFGVSLNDRSVEPSEAYVLKQFSDEELLQLPHLIDAAASATERVITQTEFEPTTIKLATT